MLSLRPFWNQADDVLDGHAEFLGLGRSAVLENTLGDLDHGRVHAAQQLVGVDHDANTGLRQFILGRAGIRRWHRHQRHAIIELCVSPAEGHYLVGSWLLAVDHNAVRAGSDVGLAAGQRVVHVGLENQTFDAGDDHEVVSHLRMLPAGDLVGEVLDVILYLLCVGTEQRVSLQPFLIFNDHGRDAQTLQRADHEHEMLCDATGIAVKDDGLGRGLENIADGVHALHVLDVWLGLDGRVREAAQPDPVEFPHSVVAFDEHGLGDQSRQATVRFDNANQRFGFQQPLQHSQSHLRRGADFPKRQVERYGRDAGHMLRLDKLPTPLLKCIDDALAGLSQHPGVPVARWNT